MNSSSCSHSLREALYRVFVRQCAQTRALQASTSQSPFLHVPSVPSKCIAQWRGNGTLHARGFTSTARALAKAAKDSEAQEDLAAAFAAEAKRDKRFMTAKDFEKSKRSRLPQDYEITDPKIMVIDGENPIEGPFPTRRILERLEPGESLRMVKVYELANPKEGKMEPELAVCRIVNKKDEFLRVKQSEERKKQGAKPKAKALELSWVIGQHDLDTKIRRLVDFLGKGHKVEVVIARKRKKGPQPQVDVKEATAVLKQIRQAATDNKGHESKEASGEIGTRMTLTFEVS